MGLFPASDEEQVELRDLCRKVLKNSPYVPGKVWEREGGYHYVICYVGTNELWTRCGIIYANVEDLRMHRAAPGSSDVHLVSDIQFDHISFDAIIELGLALMGPLRALGAQAEEPGA